MSDDTKKSDDARIDALRTAAEEAARMLETSLRQIAGTSPEDEAVRALGERIGYGAMMHAASRLWAESLRAKGYPDGGEFLAGPCVGTARRVLADLRAALDDTPLRLPPEPRLKTVQELLQHCDDWGPDNLGVFKLVVALYLTLDTGNRNRLAEEFEAATTTIIRWATGTVTPRLAVQKMVVEYIRASVRESEKLP